MKKFTISLPVLINFIFLISLVVSCTQQEKHVDIILSNILSSKTAIEQYITKQSIDKSVHPIFVTFWDFDGTILKGDCSDGYKENDRQIYRGLVQIAIEQNFSKLYKENEFDVFSNYYEHLDRTQGHLAAYTYLTTIFAGQNEDAIIKLSTQYFNETLQHYYFSSSIAIMNELIKNNIHIYIISASPDFFVKGAAQSLKINPDAIHGIKLKNVNGILTNTIVPPVTYAKGKTMKVLQIMKHLQQKYSTDHVYALAAFGNSYHTDGPFLEYVAKQKLPAGTPVAVMINGGKEPDAYKGLFYCVKQSKIIQYSYK